MATRGINRATVLGYLSRDPRITITGNGSLRAHISIATTETWEVWTYRMLPLAAPGAGHERRSDTIGAL